MGIVDSEKCKGVQNISKDTDISKKETSTSDKRHIQETSPYRKHGGVCKVCQKRLVYTKKRPVCTKRDLPKRAICTKHTMSRAEHVKRDLNIRGKYRCRLAEETHTYRNHDEVCYVCQKRRVYTKKRPAPWKREASKRPVYIGNTTRFTNSVKRNI